MFFISFYNLRSQTSSTNSSRSNITLFWEAISSKFQNELNFQTFADDTLGVYAVVHLPEWCLLTPTIWGSDPVIGNFKHNGDTCFDIFGILDTFGAICWSLLEPNGRATKLVQKIPKDGTKCVNQKL